MGILEWMVQSLRERGLNDEADAHEAVMAGEGGGAGLGGGGYGGGGGDHGGGGAGLGGGGGGDYGGDLVGGGDHGGGSIGGDHGGDHGGGDHGHDAQAGGGQDAAVNHDGPGSPAAMRGGDHGALHEPHSPDSLDPRDPLSGLHSDRLRESLSREAFRSASMEAQDAAIAERVLPPNFKAFMESAEHASFPSPQPLDEWRASRSAAIAALGDALPNFARGEPHLAPSLTRAADAGPAVARDAAPARALAPGTSAARGQNKDFER